MHKRYHFIFSGTVQGVGFRYTARALAEKYSLTGWAANLVDGRVELEIEGDEADIKKFLDDLRTGFKSYISGVGKEEIASLSKETGFYIKFLR